jgi:cation diffusion facilitator CzcD-associated flavoprotein CzcO
MTSDHVDVLIIGAGLSGIGAGVHLQTNCPGKSYAILEARAASGGTWDLFRYPGIRSDSDMYTLGYRFRPWKAAKAIADGPSILEYVRETARDYDIDRHIRYHHRVARAEWSTPDSRWTVDVERTDTGETVQMTCNFLFSASGYYRYDEPYTPELPGLEQFGGQVVHPQLWSDAVDYKFKRVVVIGSGATAVTLVPAMAEDAEHVTMLQRSPSYVISLPGVDPIAQFVRKLLPEKLAYVVVRWKNVMLATAFFQLSRRRPKFVRGLLRRGVQAELGRDYPIDPHFTPKYNPWDQRLCLVPDSDLFRVLRSGKASMATDTIETFTERGIKLTSGAELEADVVVTATGLNLQLMGGVELTVDGREIRFSDALGYKGMMFSDVPNMAAAMGYTNASWTLKCDLTCEYVCRLLNHMDEHGYAQVTPRNDDPSLETQPFIDLQSGYVQRSIDKFPKQGVKWPWRLYQNYPRDILLLRHGRIVDDALEFKRAGATAARETEQVAA